MRSRTPSTCLGSLMHKARQHSLDPFAAKHISAWQSWVSGTKHLGQGTSKLGIMLVLLVTPMHHCEQHSPGCHLVHLTHAR